jgi:hypothetical protein
VESFRRWLVKHTGCKLQEGSEGKDYPCGTCTIHLLSSMGINVAAPEYDEHNEPVDRLNEVWRFILQMRGDKKIQCPRCRGLHQLKPLSNKCGLRGDNALTGCDRCQGDGVL